MAVSIANERRKVLRKFNTGSTARIPLAPLTREQAAVVLQRRVRGNIARARVRNATQSNAAVGMAVFLSTTIGQLARRLVDDVLLAPVNVASEQLIRHALGKILSVLVVGDATGLIKFTTSGIVVGGSGGLRFDDEALAALLGGTSPFSRVWISQVIIKIPVMLTAYPITVKVRRVELQMPPDSIELSPARLAELRAALWGKKPRAAQKPPVGDRGARAAGAPSASGAPAVAVAAAAKAEDDDDDDDDKSYGPLERALDGIAVTVDIVKVTKLGRAAHAKPFEVVVPSAGATAAELRLRSCGPFVCGLRRAAPTGARPCVPQLRALLRALGVGGANAVHERDLAPAPAGSTIVLLEGVRVVNANSSFLPLDRLAMHETRDPGPGETPLVAIGRALGDAVDGIGQVFGFVGAQLGGLFASAKPSPDAAPPAAPPPARAARPRREVKVHVYKRLEVQSLSASSANGTLDPSPFVEGFELAVHAHLVRAKRTGKLAQLDVDLVLPGHPIAYQMPAPADEVEAASNEEMHGALRVRMDASPLTAVAPSAVVQRYFYAQQFSTRADGARGGANVLYQLGEGLLGGLTRAVGMPVRAAGGGARRIAQTLRGSGAKPK